LNAKKLDYLKRALIDTGTIWTIVSNYAILAELFEQRKTAKETVRKTNGGLFITKHELELCFVLLEFALSKEITWIVAMDESKTRRMYDMIICCHLVIIVKRNNRFYEIGFNGH